MREEPLEIILQLREHQLQLNLREREFRKEAATEYARMVSAHQLQSQQFMKDYGQMAVRSLFLLNGGALVSLITFMGSSSQFTFSYPDELVPTNLVQGFPWFLFGLIFAVVMMFMAFVNFGEIADSYADFGSLSNAIVELKEAWPHDFSDGKSNLIRWTYRGAVTAGVLSLLSFFAGCLKIIGPAFALWHPGMLFPQ
jgi:hypothetical protein